MNLSIAYDLLPDWGPPQGTQPQPNLPHLWPQSNFSHHQLPGDVPNTGVGCVVYGSLDAVLSLAQEEWRGWLHVTVEIRRMCWLKLGELLVLKNYRMGNQQGWCVFLLIEELFRTPESSKSQGSCQVGGFNFFFMFIPKIGEDEPNLTSICSDGLVKNHQLAFVGFVFFGWSKDLFWLGFCCVKWRSPWKHELVGIYWEFFRTLEKQICSGCSSNFFTVWTKTIALRHFLRAMDDGTFRTFP